MRSVLLDGQLLHGRDRFGKWHTTEVAGWNSPAPFSTTHAAAVGAATVAPGTRTVDQRPITVTGILAARDHLQAQQARHVLTGLLQDPAHMVVDSGGQSTYRVVRDLEMDDPIVRGKTVHWQLTVVALDPHRYGAWQKPVVSDGGTVKVFHRGNGKASPVVTVQGSAPNGYEISYQGREFFEVLTPLQYGQIHVVDFHTGRAYFGDTVLSNYGRARAIRIRKGAPQDMRVRPIGSGNIAGAIEVQDTWV